MESRFWVTIDGQQIPVTKEVRDAVWQCNASVHYRAYQEKRCSQGDIHKCCGDCSGCMWQRDGLVVSLDSFPTDNSVVYDSGQYVEESLLKNDMWNTAFAIADRNVRNGALLIRLRFIDGLSCSQIAVNLNIPRRTVYRMLDRIIECLREEKKLFF